MDTKAIAKRPGGIPMSKCTALFLLCDKYRQRAFASDAVKWAIQELVEGRDSESLRRLAATHPTADWWEVEPLMERSFAELGYPYLAPEPCYWACAEEIAGDIVAGRLAASPGCARMYEMWVALDYPPALRGWSYLVDDLTPALYDVPPDQFPAVVLREAASFLAARARGEAESPPERAPRYNLLMLNLRQRVNRVLRSLRSLDHTEWIPLAVLLAAALATWAFVELADEVAEGDLAGFDRAVLLLFRNPADPTDPLGPAWFEDYMRDITALGSLGVLSVVVVAVCAYLWLAGKHAAVAYVLVAVLGALALSSILKELYDRPRPDLFPRGADVFTASFPSGHSVMSAATYLTLGALLARYQQSKRLRAYLIGVAMLLTLAVGISRLYFGVHWPSDVLAGWSIGAAWALVCWAVAALLQRRGVIERQPIE
jgi:undecaprenyl-diphosphatase